MNAQEAKAWSNRVRSSRADWNPCVLLGLVNQQIRDACERGDGHITNVFGNLYRPASRGVKDEVARMLQADGFTVRRTWLGTYDVSW